MQRTRGILVTILVVFWSFVNVVDSTQEFNDYFDFTTDPQCDSDMQTQANTCPFTDSACQESLDKALQCRYNETLERIKTLYSYTQEEIANINARAASFRVNMEKSLENLDSRTKRSTSHVKELFGTFASGHGKMAALRGGEMSAKEQETRQDDLVFMNAFFDDVNETMCEVISRLESSESTLNSLLDTTAANDAQISSLDSDVSALELSVNTLEDEVAQVEQEIDDVEADIANLKTNLTNLEDKVQELCEQVEDNTDDIDYLFNATALIPSILENLTEIEDEISDLADQLTDSLGDVANLNETLGSVQQDIDDVKDDVSSLWTAVDDLNDELNLTAEEFDDLESIIANLTDGLDNLTAMVLSLKEPSEEGELTELEENLSDQIGALNDTIQNLEESLTDIMLNHTEILSNIAELMNENQTTYDLIDSLSDDVTHVLDDVDSLEEEVYALNATQVKIMATLDELNNTIIECCEAQGNNNQTIPEPLMCCNQTNNSDISDFEDRVTALETENKDLLNLITEMNNTLMERISQLENCCSLVPGNLSLEFPFPFPLEPPHNGTTEGCGHHGCAACEGGCECEEGHYSGCAGKICALEKKIDTLLKKMPDCPDGYLAIYLDIDHSDFVCVRMETSTAIQSDQGKTCSNDGLILAEFPCVFGFQEFRQYLMGEGGSETLYFVGASDEILDGYWTWLDSTIPVNEAYWAPGQPDGGSAENCAVINSTSGLMQDEDCASLNAALCITGSH